MTHPLQPVRFSQASPRERGRAHGEMWRGEVAELAARRVEVCTAVAAAPPGGGAGAPGRVVALARGHLDQLRAHLPEFADELEGIAEGACLEPTDILILNQYADLCDALGGTERSRLDEAEGGTAIYVCGTDGPVLGQTWDSHGGAAAFLRTILVAPQGGDRETLCLTLTGCLGIAGMASSGVAVVTGELTTTDGGTGVPWPAIVRSMLDCADARAAYDRLLALPLGGGRNFMIADGQSYFGVECSGELKVLTQVGPKAAHLHTNHCFDPVLRARERVARSSTTFERLNMATTLYAQHRPRDLAGLWTLLGSHEGHPRGICSHVDDAQGVAQARTCGRMAMLPWHGRMRVAAGCSHHDDPLDLQLDPFTPQPG